MKDNIDRVKGRAIQRLIEKGDYALADALRDSYIEAGYEVRGRLVLLKRGPKLLKLLEDENAIILW